MSMEINRIYQGDTLQIMRQWPDGVIDCCVTSPPYWGLRDFGVDGQLGLEKTPEEYVEKMVAVFREVRRVLKKEGTCWLNLGDSYNGSGGAGGDYNKGGLKEGQPKYGRKYTDNLKPKDLCGIPWRVAFALQKDGWYLRQDIIWHKPNPMPESVTDRCTKAHEYIFLLTKSAKYYYDADAIREPANYDGRKDTVMKGGGKYAEVEFSPMNPQGHERWPYKNKNGVPVRNKRSVWTVATKPYSEAHFATFPPDLIKPCILAGCPKEICKKCGKARERIVKKTGGSIGQSWHNHENDLVAGMSQQGKSQLEKAGEEYSRKTIGIGWTDCGCETFYEPGIVLDPFMGSGTTAIVAYENRRNYIGIELNPEYIAMAEERIKQAKEQFALFE